MQAAQPWLSTWDSTIQLTVRRLSKPPLFLFPRAARSCGLLRLYLRPSSALGCCNSGTRFRVHAPWSSAGARRCRSGGGNIRCSRTASEDCDRAIQTLALFFQCVNDLLSIHSASSISARFSVMADCRQRGLVIPLSSDARAKDHPCRHGRVLCLHRAARPTGFKGKAGDRRVEGEALSGVRSLVRGQSFQSALRYAGHTRN
jgi:hypothetical protein